MSKSGFCAFPSEGPDSHKFCTRGGCDCNCHKKGK